MIPYEQGPKVSTEKAVLFLCSNVKQHRWQSLCWFLCTKMHVSISESINSKISTISTIRWHQVVSLKNIYFDKISSPCNLSSFIQSIPFSNAYSVYNLPKLASAGNEGKKRCIFIQSFHVWCTNEEKKSLMWDVNESIIVNLQRFCCTEI